MASHSPPLPALNVVDDERDQTAGLRILRQFAVFVGVGYLAYAVLTIPAIATSLEVMDTWWTVLALPVTFGTGIAVGLFSWKAPARRIKTAATVAVASYLVTIGSWWFGWNGRFLDGDSMWFSLFCGLAAIAAAVAFRPAYAFLVLCIVVPATVTINHIVRAPELNGPLLPDMAWAFAFSLIYFAAAVMAMRIAAILDSTRAQAYAATAEASALHARLTERQRFAQLTHDGIMSTLLSAARQGASDQLAHQARVTLADLDDLSSATTTPTGIGVPIEEALAQIRAACTAIDPGLHIITVDTTSREGQQYPLEVVRAIASAAGEAVRNSCRHAGARATTAVTVAAHPNRLGAEIVDDGVGFDPRAIPTERLGIAVSIRNPMHQFPGGSATIDSSRGNGTRVLLEWSNV